MHVQELNSIGMIKAVYNILILPSCRAIWRVYVVMFLPIVVALLFPETFLGDLAANFLPQILLLGIFAVIYSITRKSWNKLIIAVLFSALPIPNLCARLYPFAQLDPSQGKDSDLIRVTSVNLFRGLWSTERATELIVQSKPDILALQELTPKQAEELKKVFSDYPFGVVVPSPDDFGIALLSRYPLIEHKVVQLIQNGPLSIDATLEIEGTSIHLIATHPVPPSSFRFFSLRNKQLVALSAAINTSKKPSIIVGDLNTSNFSSYFQKLLFDSSLLDPRQGRGFYFSWPTFIPMLATSIDHILVSEDFTLQKFSTGPHIWSDHLPVSAVLQLKEKP